jgi:hypothetical protein
LQPPAQTPVVVELVVPQFLGSNVRLVQLVRVTIEPESHVVPAGKQKSGGVQRHPVWQVLLV